MKKIQIPFKKIEGTASSLFWNNLYHYYCGEQNPYTRNSVITGNEKFLLGFILPPFQRPESWSIEQKKRFIESAFLGLDIGQIVVAREFEQITNGWLIDGQQRLTAIRDFFDEKFTIFNNICFKEIYHDKLLYDNDFYNYKKNNQIFQEKAFNHFQRISFNTVIIEDCSPELLEIYYNRMNYGGTPHKLKQDIKFDL